MPDAAFGPQYHVPVLLPEILELMHVHPGATLIDCTAGDGGHVLGFLRAAGPQSRVLALDRDAEAIRRARRRLAALALDHQITWVQTEFAALRQVAQARGFAPVDNVLADLGFSSHQVDTAERGFSFRLNGPLDMRMDRGHALTAADVVNGWTEEDLAALLSSQGEEPHARRIARVIVQHRPFAHTRQLAQAIETAAPPRAYRRRHPATRTFQALRMAVNDELRQLTAVLPQAVELLTPGGRLCVISFHSLEDRAVKRFLRSRSRRVAANKYRPALPRACPAPALALLGGGVIRPSRAEQAANPRSRSARLRAARKPA